MSSRDCYNLEGYLHDCLYYAHFNILHRMLIVREAETKIGGIRQSVDYWLNDEFDEETMSWRSYRNSLYQYFEDISAYIDVMSNDNHSYIGLVLELLYPTKHADIITIAGVDTKENLEKLVLFLLHYDNADMNLEYKTFMVELTKWWANNLAACVPPQFPIEYKV